MPNLLSEDRICVGPVKRAANTPALKPAQADADAAVPATASTTFSMRSKISSRQIAAAVRTAPHPATEVAATAYTQALLAKTADQADLVRALRSTPARMHTTHVSMRSSTITI